MTSPFDLMQVMWGAHKTNTEIAIMHTNRDNNSGADRPAAGNGSGFEASQRLSIRHIAKDWDILSESTSYKHAHTFSKNQREVQKSTNEAWKSRPRASHHASFLMKTLSLPQVTSSLKKRLTGASPLSNIRRIS